MPCWIRLWLWNYINLITSIDNHIYFFLTNHGPLFWQPLLMSSSRICISVCVTEYSGSEPQLVISGVTLAKRRLVSTPAALKHICNFHTFCTLVGRPFLTKHLLWHLWHHMQMFTFSHACRHIVTKSRYKQRVLMHGHQGWNVRHGLCHIYIRYVCIYIYIYELFIAFVSFVVCSLL